jgi:PTH2 family peptidyl-tRNA hydrolase
LEDLKQAIILRADLGMGPGKKCAQACHACLLSAEQAQNQTPAIYKAWKQSGQKKVVLKVPDLDSLSRLYHLARKTGLPAAIIQDAGLTQLEPGTTTAVGIGPAQADKIDKICGDLKLL